MAFNWDYELIANDTAEKNGAGNVNRYTPFVAKVYYDGGEDGSKSGWYPIYTPFNADDTHRGITYLTDTLASNADDETHSKAVSKKAVKSIKIKAGETQVGAMDGDGNLSITNVLPKSVIPVIGGGYHEANTLTDVTVNDMNVGDTVNVKNDVMYIVKSGGGGTKALEAYRAQSAKTAQTADTANSVEWSDIANKPSLVQTGGGTINGTLVLSQSNTVSGTAYSNPALVVGGSPDTAHIEVGKDRIHAKAGKTTYTNLYLNPDGGKVYVGKNEVSVVGHVHDYLSTAGGTVSSNLTVSGNLTVNGTITGTSTAANKLSTTNTGSATQPVYFANGVPVTCTQLKSAAYQDSGAFAAASHNHDSVYSKTNHTHNYAGASSSSGAANSANKLNTDAGSDTNPVYFKNGVPVATSLKTDCTYQKNSNNSVIAWKRGDIVTIRLDGIINNFLTYEGKTQTDPTTVKAWYYAQLLKLPEGWRPPYNIINPVHYVTPNDDPICPVAFAVYSDGNVRLVAINIDNKAMATVHFNTCKFLSTITYAAAVSPS